MSQFNRNNHIIINILSTLILSLYSPISKAQIFDNSQPHFRVKWNQINTENFRLIFPQEYNKSAPRSEEHTSELQSRENLVCRLLLEKKKRIIPPNRSS